MYASPGSAFLSRQGKMPAHLFYELLVFVPLMEITGTQGFPRRPGDSRLPQFFPGIFGRFEGILRKIPENGFFLDLIRTEGQIVPDGRQALEIQVGQRPAGIDVEEVMGIRPYQAVRDRLPAGVVIDAKAEVQDLQDRQCQAVSDFFRPIGRFLGVAYRVEQVLYFFPVLVTSIEDVGVLFVFHIFPFPAPKLSRVFF